MSMKPYVYKNINFRLSTKQMANVMYALIITKSTMSSSYGVGIYEFTQAQNCHNRAYMTIHIDPDMIDEFTELTGLYLDEPQKISVN